MSRETEESSTKKKAIAAPGRGSVQRKNESIAVSGKGPAKRKKETIVEGTANAKTASQVAKRPASSTESNQKSLEAGRLNGMMKRSCKSKDISKQSFSDQKSAETGRIKKSTKSGNIRIKKSGGNRKRLPVRHGGRRRHHSGRAFFLSSILLTVFSVGLMFFQNSELQVYAEEAAQAIASTVGIDTTLPTLSAAVSDGYLQIVAEDKESRVDRIYVCGYEYSGLLNNALSIRLQQFDAGYPQFSIYAIDSAGNISQEYLVDNPYYEAPDGTGAGAADALPVDAAATSATSATGTVTEHSTTASSGSTSSQSNGSGRAGTTGSSGSGNNSGNNSGSSSGNSSGRSSGSNGSGHNGASYSSGSSFESAQSAAKRNVLQEADALEDGAIPMEDTGSRSVNANEGGKEFYTIKTGNDKTFYLIIDRDKSAENVHFLTDISERDLLNATQDNSSTLPRNSAVMAGSTTGSLVESALPNSNPLSLWQDAGQEGQQKTGEQEDGEESPDPEAETGTVKEGTEGGGDSGFALPAGNIIRLILIGGGIVAVAAIVVVIHRKRKGDEDEIDEDDEDEDDEEDENGTEYPDDDIDGADEENDEEDDEVDEEEDE